VTDVPAAVETLASGSGYTQLRPVGGGMEFRVFAANASDGSEVVLRTPIGGRFQSNPNDRHVDTRSLLRWEFEVTRYLHGCGFPVAAPRELVLGEPDVLISAYVTDDGHGADQTALGALLRQLHHLPAPPMAPVAANGLPPVRLLPRRIADRFAELAVLVPGLPALPDTRQLAAALTGGPSGRLLHLDVRAPNLRCGDGAVRAVLDWSNALTGDPLLELGRIAEYALLPENGLDYHAILVGYGEPIPADSPRFWIYRLDTAVMLALLFSSEVPHVGLGPRSVDRLRQVHERLTWILDG
jgi:aminoglycoside phosphotransferase (APT) family kinase protein